MRLGVFGGSFDPVHRGHLRLAEAALDALNLDKVLFVPARQNPLKAGGPALPAALRLKLLRRALRSRARFGITTAELKRRGPSYTVDTLRGLRRKYPSATLYFLCGADASGGFARWRRPAEILSLARVVAMTRPGHEFPRLPRGAMRLDFDALPVSASLIRRWLARGRDVSAWVPPGTARLLQQHYGRLPSKKTRKSN